MKKFINQYIFIGLAALSLSFGATSCTDYLDKEPDSDVGADEAFKNFTNFQGFVEEIYNCIPNKESNFWCCTFNWGEDELMNSGGGESHETTHFDLGDYRYWYQDPQSFLHANDLNPTSTDKFTHSLEHAWYCIRKANLGLENMEKMTEGTQEERNFVKGQLLFFRAWWHEELMQFFGGIPYVDKVLPSDQKLTLPRQSFKECAELCAADFREAANLLPDNWDNTTIGKKTLGRNDLRITKAVALGYLGKVLLWAASPMNELGAQVGASKNGNTYKYNTEIATRAADALAECIANIESGKTPYALAEYNYDNIYDHVAAAGSTTNYSDIFRTTGQNWKMPGSCEAMFRGPVFDINGTNWNFAKLWGPKVNNLVEHDAIIHMPTANYVNYYGMANGLPLDDPESGFDPRHPFQNRDPRFYHDIIFDGFHYVLSTDALNSDQKKLEYCELFTGGAMRSVADGSSTGYFIQKLIPHQCNEGDKWYDYDHAFQSYLPYMRLADIYLMYAEAMAAIATDAKGLDNRDYCPLSAVDAINALRDRVNSADYPMEHVAPNLRDTREHFIDEVRRERAVELAFEGLRWNDLQRWLLLTEPPYTMKYSHEFERLEKDDWFKTHDPKDAKVGNFHREELITRHLESKHYWFPLPDKDIYLYEGFPQNPGW